MKDTLNKKLVFMTAHGGVGDFLFQLDLAKRLEERGVDTVFLVRKNKRFFSEIVSSSNVRRVRIIPANGIFYGLSIFYALLNSISGKVAIVNSFHSTRFRLPTRLYYAVASLLSVPVVICKKQLDPDISYKQVVYEEGEKIWQRNERLANLVSGKDVTQSFPILEFNFQKNSNNKNYVHIHPLASCLKKSYPPIKLAEVIKLISLNNKIVFTIRPSEEVWYMTEGLRTQFEKNGNVKLISKNFSFQEICEHIYGSSVFCTVNTGLMWLAIMLRKQVVVLDTYTDPEWNPSGYDNVVRLSHDFDENGQSLHLVERLHDDGTFFESMYRIEPKEVAEAINSTKK